MTTIQAIEKIEAAIEQLERHCLGQATYHHKCGQLSVAGDWDQRTAGVRLALDELRHHLEAHRQSADEPSDQQRAIEVMKRYGCYVIPWEADGQFSWHLRDKDGFNFDPNELCVAFPTPEAALLAAGEYLDAQGKERGE